VVKNKEVFVNTYISHIWKDILFASVVITVFGSAVQAFGTAAASQEITLIATVREPSGTSGTVAFTFALEELPVASAVLPNVSTLPPQPSVIPEPTTLVLVGLGVLGLVVWRRMWEKH
jgi:hypothetical protein